MSESTQLRWMPYIDQADRWPAKGRALLAQFDDQSVVVYQALPKRLGRKAAETGTLALPGYKFDTMGWITPTFLHAMDLWQWGSGPDQGCVLALWIERAGFDAILSRAVHQSFVKGFYDSPEQWKALAAASEVRLDWDYALTPDGRKLERRVLALGLAGQTQRRFAAEWLRRIEDISETVASQAAYRMETDFLLSPAEKPYPISDPAVIQRLGL